MTEYDHLDAVLGKRLVAYYSENDELLFKFDDGTLIQWVGYRSHPIDADDVELREIWEARAAGEWVEVDDV